MNLHDNFTPTHHGHDTDHDRFLHWLLILLACGGAAITRYVGDGWIKREP